MRAVGVMVLFTMACASEPPMRIPSHGSDAVMALERLSGDGSFVGGQRERFRLLWDGTGRVSFATSDGELSWDGREVEWTLPFAERAWLRAEVDTGGGEAASATFYFAVWAVAATARGVVDTSNDATGDACDLEIGPGDIPHIIYRNDTHPSLWYATYEGAAWRTELVDGMGWDTGGLVRTDMALTLDGSGQPHIVYMQDTGTSERVRYATRSGTTWLLETIEAASNLEGRVDIEIGSTGQPVVLHTRWISGTGYVTRVAARTGANSWTVYSAPAGFRSGGGLELDGAGVMHVSLMTSSSVSATTWTTAGWATAVTVRLLNSTTRVPLALDAQGRDVLMHQGGIAHDLGGRVWSHSEVESSAMLYYDLAVAGAPHLAIVHSGSLELVTPDSRGYWMYANAGSADSGPLAVAVDGSGNTHACFQYGNRIMFY